MIRVITYITCFLLAFWFGSCSSAQHAVIGVDDPLPNTILWQIKSDDIDQPSYLLGTIHIIPEDLYFWPFQFEQALNATNQIVLETNELDMDPSAMMGILPKLMMPGGQSIEDLVSDEDYTTIKNYFDDLGIPLAFLKNIKPFFLFMLVDIDFGTMFRDGIKSYEMEIMDKAKKENKTVFGLETLDSQMGIFDSIPYNEQADLLVQSIEQKSLEAENPGKDAEMHSLFQSYLDQDLNAMLIEIKETDVTIRKYNKLFLDNRNKDWIPKIEKLIHEAPTFIAVGAAHLPGNMGVIRLLQKAGYTLVPIMNTNGSN